MMENLMISLFKKAVDDGKIHINIDFDEEFSKISNDLCFQTILRIREILDNHELSDTECFESIEEIVSALESVGLNSGSRHDF